MELSEQIEFCSLAVKKNPYFAALNKYVGMYRVAFFHKLGKFYSFSELYQNEYRFDLAGKCLFTYKCIYQKILT